MNGRDYLSLTFRIIGALFVVAALGVTVTTAFFVSAGSHYPGTIVDHSVIQNSISVQSSERATGMLYYPVVEFEDENGATVRFTGRSGRSTRVNVVGESVDVIARPGGRDARINSVMGVWGGSIILAAMGAVFLLISVVSPLGFGGKSDSRPQAPPV